MTYATLSTTSPRYDDWHKVFGSGRIPILSPIAEGQFYKIAVSELKPDVQSRLARSLSESWKIPVDQVLELSRDSRGVFIRTEDVTLEMDLF